MKTITQHDSILRYMAAMLFMMMFVSSVSAKNVHSTNELDITRIVFFSESESIYPKWAGLVQVMLSPAAIWAQTTDCHSGSLAIRGADKHLVAAVMAARASGKKLKIYVDDVLRVEGTSCYLRAVSY